MREVEDLSIILDTLEKKRKKMVDQVFKESLNDRIFALLTSMSEGSVDELIPEYGLQSEKGYSIHEAIKFLKVKPGEELSILNDLVNRGLLTPRKWARLNLCPFCQNFHLRVISACPVCGGENINITDLIHHFPCGYVDVEGKFLKGEALVCPKCDKRLSHIGVDYERQAKIHFCLDCNKPFSSVKIFYQCLKCDKKSDPDIVLEETLYSYRLSLEAPALIEAGEIFSPEHALIDIHSGIYNRMTFEEILEKERKRASRYGTVCTLLQVSILNWDECVQKVGLSVSSEMITEIAILLKEELRDVDIIGWINRKSLAAMLPETGPSNTEIAEKRLKERIDSFFAGEKFKIKPEIALVMQKLGKE